MGDGTIFKRHMKADGSIGRDMEIEEAKAALIYEALRRRAEVQQAWLERKWDKRAKGFQGSSVWPFRTCTSREISWTK